jgi:signal peptidase I
MVRAEMSIDNLATSRPARWRRRVIEFRGIAFIILGVLAARSTLADHYYVPSGSMEHTLIAGDRVVVDKMAYGLRFPFTNKKITDGGPVTRGEVVIFSSPRDGIRLIKRIVAVGGDTVSVRDGHLLINGQAVAADGDSAREVFGDRIVDLNLAHGGGPDYEQTLADGMLLAMGDHRGNSMDGRIFGLIREDAVYGRALAVYYRSGDGLVWNRL